MQKLLLFPILTVVILSACQPSGKTRQEKSSVAPAAPVTADTLSAKATASEEQKEPFEDTPALSYEKRVLSAAEKQQLLTEHNFASLWAMEQRKGAAVYNGFYGPDHYRIEFYFASVTRDSLQLGHFNITGKSRYKKNITPFAGTFTIDSIATLQVLNRQEMDTPVDFGRQYLAFGQFDLREDSLAGGAGQFRGNVMMDFSLDKQNQLSFEYFLNTPARNAGFLCEGEWRSYQTGKTKPVLWADNFFAVARGVLEDFDIGERDVEINPKYRHLGWDTYWSGEEWWNEPGLVLQ